MAFYDGTADRTATWDPGQYGRFADHRARPFFELVRRIGAADPTLVVDLGCGSGELTATLADRWPSARVAYRWGGWPFRCPGTSRHHHTG